MLELLRNAHHTVTIDPVSQIARVTRSALPSESVAQFEELWMEVSRALDRVDRHRLCLLIDLRAAVGRNDPQFEAAMQRIRPPVMGRFRRVAILVRTTAGALQIQRHFREDGIDRMIGSDEARLLDYLREAPARVR
ncbi:MULTISPECIES: hypothetical protein [Sorangium]|uniref:STAS/SEC14 domain-containing protein n=1 Tax=Sorangium cellulosum (strain So ce56) TaxID=448385 RepID=A9GY54_SORC5|nr:hypothetical protein [Sorangium cellulosum]CAN97187.1 hypothetical protein predicted by Glimmer/Critica [Sorangium cellulosum So ce56]